MRIFALATLVIALIASFSAQQVNAAVAADLISYLPGYGTTPTTQYSGFIAADSAKTVFLHYWFVLAETNSSTAPVVMWMNGGPGCSSLEGYLYEQGPFTFTGDIVDGLPTLKDNPNAWSKVANMLFLEQPIGVGFSYATNGSTTSDDFTQSQNTYGFVLNFFKAYPEFAKNDFYITGESYAGIYVPTLANRIRLGNAAGNQYVNLKGFAVGNGCIGNSVGSCGDGGDSIEIEVDLFYGHGMVPQDLYAQINAACGNFSNPSNECINLYYSINTGNINIYNVYDTCGDDTAKRTTEARLQAPAPRYTRRPKKNNLRDPIVCIPSALGPQYLLNSTVQKAIHVDSSPYASSWSECADIDYNSNLVSLLPTYPDLIALYNVLIYSGDADACVPYNGSEDWTRKLGYTPVSTWAPWTVTLSDNSYVGGFAVVYNANFTFATVKHAGHMVPQFEPESALTMFENWLFSKGWN